MAPPPLPKNWPPTLPYLTTPTSSKTLTPSHLTALKTRPKDTPSIQANTPKGPCPHVKITPIITPSHPACGQSGLFAAKDLKPGSFILHYIGHIHAESDTNSNSDYDLSLDREMGVGIDADQGGNEARFVNDYRGVREKPNAEFREVWDEREGRRGIGVWVLPEGKGKKGRGIGKGEEICVSYGRGFWGARRGGGAGDDLAEK